MRITLESMLNCNTLRLLEHFKDYKKNIYLCTLHKLLFYLHHQLVTYTLAELANHVYALVQIQCLCENIKEVINRNLYYNLFCSSHEIN